MIKKELIVSRRGRKFIVVSQYDDAGRLLRMLGRNFPAEKKKEEEWEVDSPFLKIWEK